MIKSLHPRIWSVVLFFFLSLTATLSRGAGLFSDGADARTISLGGAGTAQDTSAIAAFDSNPSALATLSGTQVELNAGAAFVRGTFDRDDGIHSHLNINTAALPAGAVSLALPTAIPITIGLGFVPEVELEADWRYFDRLGGLGGATSYGEQDQRSRILGLRSQVGVAVSITKWISIGVSGGAIYNENFLHAPYVFQSQPALAGFKTLLDLETNGWGPSFTFGTQIRPTRELTIGLSYRPSTIVYSEGDASGNASAQLLALGGGFALVDPNFHYNAEVRTKFPQVVSTGIEWQALPRLRLIGGIDWINWSDAFDRLEIRLTSGNNAGINGVVGSDSMIDIVPLRWRDQFVYRGGVECNIAAGFMARAGYTYARSAVPSDTMTPLNAAIFEHKVSAGIGYKRGRYHVDLAWQWSLPTTERVGTSQLLDGEYSQSRVRVSEHLLALTNGFEF